jgi:hypothetical protein
MAPSCAGDGEVGTNNRKMFQGKVKTEWLTKGALSPTLLKILAREMRQGW